MGNERPDTNTRQSASTDSSPKTRRFWKAMLELFGERWTQSYGPEPSPLWTSAIEMLSGPELKTAMRQLLNSGAEHPPTLPKLLELARAGQPKKNGKHPDPYSPEWNERRKALMAEIATETRKRGVVWIEVQRARSIESLALAEQPLDAPERQQFTASEGAAGRWFVARAKALRFVGMPAEDVGHLRTQCIAACDQLLPFIRSGDPDVTSADLIARLDTIAEELYPAAQEPLTYRTCVARNPDLTNPATHPQG